MAKAATIPKTKHADRMILPSSSQKYSWMYLRVCRSRESNHYRSPISSSFFFLLLPHTKLLTSIFYQLKQVIELLDALNNITFMVVGLWKHMEWNLMSLHCILGAVLILQVSVTLGEKCGCLGWNSSPFLSLVWKIFDPNWISYAYLLFFHSAAFIRTKSQAMDSVHWLELCNLTRDCRG